MAAIAAHCRCSISEVKSWSLAEIGAVAEAISGPVEVADQEVETDPLACFVFGCSQPAVIDGLCEPHAEMRTHG